jgi:hypothetical protein
MSPLFRRNEEKAARNAAARVEIDRLRASAEAVVNARLRSTNAIRPRELPSIRLGGSIGRATLAASVSATTIITLVSAVATVVAATATVWAVVYASRTVAEAQKGRAEAREAHTAPLRS